ncbi:MAG: annexin, partial [Anaerolineae bacterium]|nr:annexin [Anaerolineae bacterium]
AVQRLLTDGRLDAQMHPFDGLPAVRGVDGVVQKADLEIQRDSIEDRLNEAMDGWGTDEDAIMSITARATPAEKLAVLNNPRLVSRLAGELNQGEMLQVLTNLNAPLAKRLNVAMDGWGTDESAIMSITAGASAAEKQAVLNDKPLVSRLAGELSQADMLQVLANLNAPLAQRLNVAMDGWGTDEATIMSLTAAASAAEKQAILNDKAMVSRLAGELSQGEMLQVLENLDAPLELRLNTAMDGWGTDEEAIYKITKNATEAQKRAIGDNTTLMMRLIDELTEDEMQRVVKNLGLQGAAVFTNATDTGNEYTSLAVMFKDGLTISKDVQFIEEGTFGANGFDNLKARLIGAVTSYLSGKYKVRVSSPTGGPKDGDGDYPITVRVNDQPSADYPMRMHGGEHGRSGVTEDGGDIYELGQASEASVPDIVLAHESAHMMLGASDEYANASVPGRVISNDHSLMGNFYTQGIAAAEIKARHFEFLVKIVNGWFPDRTVSIEK